MDVLLQITEALRWLWMSWVFFTLRTDGIADIFTEWAFDKSAKPYQKQCVASSYISMTQPCGRMLCKHKITGTSSATNRAVKGSLFSTLTGLDYNFTYFACCQFCHSCFLFSSFNFIFPWSSSNIK